MILWPPLRNVSLKKSAACFLDPDIFCRKNTQPPVVNKMRNAAAPKSLYREPLFVELQPDDYAFRTPFALQSSAKLVRQNAIHKLAAKPSCYCWSDGGRSATFRPNHQHFMGVTFTRRNVEGASRRRERAVLKGVSGEFVKN